MSASAVDVLHELRRGGVARGDLVALTMTTTGLAVAARGVTASANLDQAAPSVGLVELVGHIEHEMRPRWVWWSRATPAMLVEAGVRVATCWDIAAVHRLLFGGWQADPSRVWALMHDLDPETIPTPARIDLFNQTDHAAGDVDEPVRPDGHLNLHWVSGGWSQTSDRMERWAALTLDMAERQRAKLSALHDSPSARTRALATARSESAAELLGVEMSCDGLPMDRAAAEAIIARSIGPRPHTEAEAMAQRQRRDAEVLRHAPPGAAPFDLRSPGQVKSLLRFVGLEVPDTRAWRLEAMRDSHPLIEALLIWRKAERVATTYGYAWIDEHLGDGGRLRGAWTGSDGAAGRMTASAGLHNMPTDMRAGVVAEPDHAFVRADLGQIEPRVLAVISGDAGLARAAMQDDMYAIVAEQLAVDRATAKVAMLGAMYGQTTGHGARALIGLRAAYPVAMAYLDHADRRAQVGGDLRTYGGRLLPMGSANIDGLSDRDARGRAAARGRYGRNAMVQGAAAELFKFGRQRCGPELRRSTRESCCACTMSCWCTRPSIGPRPWPNCSMTACRSRRSGGHPATQCDLWPTST